MTRLATDGLYVELDYLTPEEYYVYVAEAQAAVTVEASMTVSYDSLTFGDAALTSDSTLSCIISHIEGADIVMTPFGALSCAITVDYDSVIPALAVSSALSVQETYKPANKAFLNSNFYLNSRAEVGVPIFIPSGSAAISPTQKQFGASSLYLPSTTPASYLYAADSALWNQEGSNNTLDSFWHEFRVWIYPTASQTALIMGQPDNFALYQQGTQISIRSRDPATSTWTNTYNGGTLTLNDWNYIQWVRQPRMHLGVSTRYYLWLNGSALVNNATSDANVYANTASTREFRIGYNGVNDTGRFVGYIDDAVYIKVNTNEAVPPTTAGQTIPSSYFTVPTVSNVTWPKDSRRVFQLSFNSQFNDTGPLTVPLDAKLNVTTAVTATITGPQNASATLDAVATQITLGSVDRGADLEAFTNAALTVDAIRIRGVDSTQSALSEVTVNSTIVAEGLIAVDSQFQTTISAEASREIAALLAADFNQSSDVNKIADGLAFQEVISTVLVEGNIVADAESLQSVDAALSTSADRLRAADAALDSQFTIDVDASEIQLFTAALSSEFAQTTNGDRVRFADAAMAVESSLEAEASGTITAIAMLATLGTMSVTGLKIHPGAATLASEFAQSTDTNDSLVANAAADLQVEATFDLTANRVRYADITTDSVSAVMVVTAATRPVDVAIDVNTTMSVDVVKITDLIEEVEAYFELNNAANRTRDYDANLISEANLNANGFLGSEARADLTATSTLTALAVKGTEILLQAFGDSTLNTDISRTRNADAGLTVQSEESALGDRLRFGTSALDSQFIQNTSVGANYNIVQTMSSQFGITVNTAVLQLDMYVYTIPSESRDYRVIAETREYTIFGETREYEIRR